MRVLTGVDTTLATAVAAILVHRLENTESVTVALPDGGVTLAVRGEDTLTGVLGQVRTAPRSAPSTPDIAVGTAAPDEAATLGAVAVWLRSAPPFLAERLHTLLDSLSADPDRPVHAATVVGPRERRTLLGFNPEPGPGPVIPVHELICRQAAHTPDALALRGDGRDRTYRELLDEAAAIAGRLRADGVGPGSVVGLCTERSTAMVVAVLAILLAGAAYLPLDPTHPPARRRLMLESAGAHLLMVSQESLVHSGLPVRTLAGEPLTGPAAPAEPVDWRGYRAPREVVHGLCYVIFTSGSTGTPKGVEMTHLSLANRLTWMQREYRLDAGDVVLQKTPYTFDVSVWELLWPFLAGARLVVASPDAHRDPQQIPELIARESVTTVHFVPSMLALFVAEDDAARCTSLRRVICSGEALPPKIANRLTALLPHTRVDNLYGPTEAAIDVTAWTCRRPEPDDGVPIGRPITNVLAYVLDQRGDLAPLGTAGELVLGGRCLARGYAGRPDLSAERFIETRVSGRPQRVYRTGDLARWSPAGHLDYLGRIDTQVKIRGQRVELGEIESVLNRHPDVGTAVVLLRDDLGASLTLVAYLVAEPGADPDPERIRAFAAEHLPAVMVPVRYLTLAALPLSPNGKIDRRALPAPPRRTGSARTPVTRPPSPAPLRCFLDSPVAPTTP
ncbi:MAG TPA: amino acid adenylation domain-containing protein [Actinophytocola sp.]|uniref:non-ribosomal peptide synthetase n=1 Tax=Actinophytocola sp. TaxID=1872138 RepID=UPI002DB6FD01|nr:amino acid adenylation domain-containing protein [Actinophytocola sp.]HEU5473423.1 amino acid adenylation domain-containing protein [Actinophytocola sp.]